MYKERASQVGRIMTNPRSKSEVLSETCKTRIEEKFLEDKFGIKKEFWSKAMDKGTSEENESIKLMGRVYNLFGVSKNELNFQNEFLTGTPDVIYNGEIYDVKSSWSGSTFKWFESDEEIDKNYFYQMQSYMELTGLKKANLVYCLVNAPEQMIMDEIRRQAWREGQIEPTDELEDKVRFQMTFDHIPAELRVRKFEIEYNAEIIEAIKARVVLCDEYYNSLESIINKRIELCTK
jgi:hypothetical protein